MTSDRSKKGITERNALLAGLLALVIVLALVNVATYDSMQGQITNLKEQVSSLENQNVDLNRSAYTTCQNLEQGMVQSFNLFESSMGLVGNATMLWNTSIQADQSMIASLNSTRPQGYENMIAALQEQITNYNLFLNQTIDFTKSIPESNADGLNVGNPCASFSP